MVTLPPWSGVQSLASMILHYSQARHAQVHRTKVGKITRKPCYMLFTMLALITDACVLLMTKNAKLTCLRSAEGVARSKEKPKER